ncbi:MAG TPA: hypothetical protein DEB17_06620 [Chlorobaculum sp.]|nr:hypothetical protein [Chlorobaculum sp.]
MFWVVREGCSHFIGKKNEIIKTEADRILSSALRQKDSERARIAEALIASLEVLTDGLQAPPS